MAPWLDLNQQIENLEKYEALSPVPRCDGSI